ncbi:ABC transporter substrate-binding protein [Haloimpatiens lingqiaonensis]|uniref:ABC transporter substrate-binding protein n=1 Tax=Haloimpatiens lingqiaonensis TaxID=1380675 RepID=UPI001FAA07C1|nr:ABC transporter substrate-binding protein [Haloimpatiens lingqiaonensis]
MKKIFKKMLILIMVGILSVYLVACGKESKKENSNLGKNNWETILKNSKEKKVNIYMWGGSEEVNKYMDSFIAPKVKEKYNIDLKRVPIKDAKDMINKLLTEKQVNKKEGTIDVCWINGENFKLAKDNSLLWGSFVDKLPNYNKYIDKSAKDMTKDFGEDTNGLEAPWGKAQFVLVYDSDKVKNPPKSMEELKDWVKKNPGKFTYPAPPDFTGSAFVRQCLLGLVDDYSKFPSNVDEKKFSEDAKPLWNYLKEIKPNLWREGKTYPESSGKLDELYAKGEVWMTMSYNPVHASNKVRKGTFPKSTKTYVLDKGTLSNTHYLAIPFNAPNKEAAMVVIDFMLSPEAQFEKVDPKVWGDGTVLSSEKLSKEQKEKLKSMINGEGTISQEELEKHRVPEIPSSYVEIIEKGWMDNVAKD